MNLQADRVGHRSRGHGTFGFMRGAVAGLLYDQTCRCDT